ncbi:hypothetical protein ABBQ32_004858 [Trebouxia sp. C0010 RCD-2024]
MTCKSNNQPAHNSLKADCKACTALTAVFDCSVNPLNADAAPMLDALAAGLRECNSKPFVGAKLELNSFLENMLTSRISRRVLAEQHINLHNRRPGYIGVICTHLNLCDAVDFAVQRATQVARETYGCAPEVTCTGDLQSTIPYIPTHLDYMLYELLKNAMRAVVESRDGQARLPAIHIRICEADTDVTFRISDQGGGIAPEDLTKVWQYGYTTIDQHDNSRYQGTSDLDPIWATRPESPAQYRMGGLGFGLPMSRLYAEYFGECVGSSTLLTLWLAGLLNSSAVLCLLWHIAGRGAHMHMILGVLWSPGCSTAILGTSRLA